jgi:excisionase family DNA binding protein
MSDTELQASFDVISRKIDNLSNLLKDKSLANIYTEILDTKEAAEYLKISTKYLHHLKDKGVIKFSQYDRVVKFRKKDLDQWIDDNQVRLKTSC